MEIRHLYNGPVTGALSVPRGVTALVGGGGKTSLLLCLARDLERNGSRVIVSTTTHIWPPEGMPVLLDPSERAITDALEESPLVAIGSLAADGKLCPCSIDPARLAELADYVLLEADGAKRLPLKAPAAHEPVIPPCTGLVLAVAGLDGLGRPMEETAFRPEIYGTIIGCTEPAHRITPADAALVLTDERGQHKGVLPGMRFALVLNKADDAARRALAEEIAQAIPAGKAEAVYSICLKELSELC